MSKKVVVIGGGTGLSTLLNGIKDFPWDISAIVTMTDNGLSSGRLRKDFGILPPGDIRQCLIALSKEKTLLAELFKYRFKKGKGLAGHSLGNLLILALQKITGSFERAVEAAGKILAIKGKVIPSTYEKVNIIAYHKNGKKSFGEREAYLMGKKNPIVKIELDNKNALANPKAIDAIKNANLILIGPGSLYTSVIANFLISDITKAILANKRAKKIYICNVSTERGETQGYSIEDHINKLLEHSDKKLIQYCLVNSEVIQSSSREYKLGEIKNISTDKNTIMEIRIIKDKIINKNNPLYHDPDKLAIAVRRLANE